MAILVIAEHDNKILKASTLSTVTAAAKLGGELHLLVVGFNAAAIAEDASMIAGVAKVLLADAPHYADQLAENIAALVVATVRAGSYSHVLAPSTTFAKNFLPRVAALLDVAQISDIIAIVAADTFVRPIYAGTVLSTVKSADTIKVITVRTSAFEAASGDPPYEPYAEHEVCWVRSAHPTGEVQSPTPVEALAAAQDMGISKLVGRELTVSTRPELNAAKIIVSGGRGLGSSENFRNLLIPLAEKLNAALGASRAAVDAGFVTNDFQVGQTGKNVAPVLYFAIGISGAIQHLAGMKDSKVIVAVNNDPEAPIFQVADYGLVADLFQAIPELTSKL